jgi:acyl carrier protein
MKSYDDVMNLCTEIFRTVFSEPQLSVMATTSASDIADWDSLAQITLLMSMEQTFEIKFSLDEVEDLQNVGEIVELILAKVDK